MANKQTAVEWLKSNLPSLFIDDSGHYRELFDKALQMERDQTIDAYVEAKTKGLPYGLNYLSVMDEAIGEAERYLDENYGRFGEDVQDEANSLI